MVALATIRAALRLCHAARIRAHAAAARSRNRDEGSRFRSEEDEVLPRAVARFPTRTFISACCRTRSRTQQLATMSPRITTSARMLEIGRDRTRCTIVRLGRPGVKLPSQVSDRGHLKYAFAAAAVGRVTTLVVRVAWAGQGAGAV